MKPKKTKKAKPKSSPNKKVKLELGKIVKVPLEKVEELMVYAWCDDNGCATRSYGGSWGEG